MLTQKRYGSNLMIMNQKNNALGFFGLQLQLVVATSEDMGEKERDLNHGK